MESKIVGALKLTFSFTPFRTPIRYQNWATGDPNNGGSYRISKDTSRNDCMKCENCAVLKSDGKWNDYPCTFRFKYICKASASKLCFACWKVKIVHYA